MPHNYSDHEPGAALELGIICNCGPGQSCSSSAQPAGTAASDQSCASSS
jgi:hypothetical protein